MSKWEKCRFCGSPAYLISSKEENGYMIYRYKCSNPKCNATFEIAERISLLSRLLRW